MIQSPFFVAAAIVATHPGVIETMSAGDHEEYGLDAHETELHRLSASPSTAYESQRPQGLNTDVNTQVGADSMQLQTMTTQVGANPMQRETWDLIQFNSFDPANLPIMCHQDPSHHYSSGLPNWYPIESTISATRPPIILTPSTPYLPETLQYEMTPSIVASMTPGYQSNNSHRVNANVGNLFATSSHATSFVPMQSTNGHGLPFLPTMPGIEPSLWDENAVMGLVASSQVQPFTMLDGLPVPPQQAGRGEGAKFSSRVEAGTSLDKDSRAVGCAASSNRDGKGTTAMQSPPEAADEASFTWVTQPGGQKMDASARRAVRSKAMKTVRMKQKAEQRAVVKSAKISNQTTTMGSIVMQRGSEEQNDGATSFT